VSPGAGGLEVHDHPIGIPILTVVRAQMSDEPNVAVLSQNKRKRRVLARAALKAAAPRSIAALASFARPQL